MREEETQIELKLKSETIYCFAPYNMYVDTPNGGASVFSLSSE